MAILRPNSSRVTSPIRPQARPQVKPQPGRTTLPSQLQPIRPGAGSGMKPQPRPQPQPVVRPQPANPFLNVSSPGRQPQPPVNQPGGGGGVAFMPNPAMIPLPPPGTAVPPPTFNLPSPVPVLGGPGAPQPQPTLTPPNLNTTPGQMGNMPAPAPAPMPAPMPQPAGPLGSAPPTVGSDVGPPGQDQMMMFGGPDSWSPEMDTAAKQSMTSDYLQQNPYSQSMSGTADQYNQYANYLTNTMYKPGGPFAMQSNSFRRPSSYSDWLESQSQAQQTPMPNSSMTGPAGGDGMFSMPAQSGVEQMAAGGGGMMPAQSGVGGQMAAGGGMMGSAPANYSDAQSAADSAFYAQNPFLNNDLTSYMGLGSKNGNVWDLPGYKEWKAASAAAMNLPGALQPVPADAGGIMNLPGGGGGFG